MLVGRLMLWGLAAGGASGVREVLDLLRSELELAMALAGCQGVSQIDSRLVRHRVSAPP